MQRLVLSFLLLMCTGLALAADDGAALLARAKSASGGEQWNALKSWSGDGTIAAGGLEGAFHAIVDLASGRSADAYKLGGIDGADGYDGTRAWQREPGGEVTALDAAEALRRARSQAWLDAHAYWFPQRIAASWGKPETRKLDGKSYQVLQATPQGGDPVTLWFGADGLLARVDQRQGQDLVATTYGDYRKVDGVRLPFHAVTDYTDAAGRTDPRRRVEIRFDKITLDAPLADKFFAMPAMEATSRILSSNGKALIRFRLANNHIYVDGGIDAKPGAHFLVDTGGLNLLTPAAAEKFGLKPEGKLSAGGVGSERMDLALAPARVITLGSVEVKRPVFYVTDLGKLAQVEGIDMDGLLGYEMFRRFVVQIDYAFQQLAISEPDKFVPPPGATVVPFELDDHIPIVSGVLDGVPVRISIDTGSRASLTMHAPFVRAHDLRTRYKAGALAVTGWGVGGAQRGYPVRMGTLELGGLKINGIAGDLFTGDKGSFANPDIGANLGGGLLRRFTVAFDYANRKMYLKPNASFSRPDSFDRSGLWLLADGDALQVADVADDSAAARAGLKVDDRIVALNGEPVAKRALADWRTFLATQAVGTKVPVRFTRNGKEETAELSLADRIAPRLEP
jgi:hypothetical protein